MKITLFMAMSLNGIIARDNYKEDFLSDYDWNVFCKEANEIGCFVMGRKTYEIITKSKDYNLNKIKNVVKIIVSRNESHKNKFYFAKSPKESINLAKKFGFKNILLAGGGNTNSEFMKLNLVNEIILNIDPVILGKGIRLFKEDNFESKLKLIHIKKLKYNIIQLHYKVK